jgi:hypothetical protein
MIWSVSTHRQKSRCQRQFFFAHYMANAKAKDLLRQRAYFLKGIKSLPLWVGSIVHYAMEEWVLPEIKQGRWPDRKLVIAQTQELALQQFQFSETGRYREVSKATKDPQYCILAPHYFGQSLDSQDLDSELQKITDALQNLLQSRELQAFLLGRPWYRCEQHLPFKVDTITIRAKPDLILPSLEGGLDIVDWKVGTAASDYSFQVAIYALATRQTEWLANYAKTGLTCYVVNLLEQEPTIALSNPFTVEDSDLDRTIDRIYESAENMRALTGDLPYNQLAIERFDYAASEGTCALCNWRELCMELGDESPAKCLSNSESAPIQLGLPFD